MIIKSASKEAKHKGLRYGYTTGSCAAAAAKAAAAMLLFGNKAEERERVELLTPKGTLLSLIPEDISLGEGVVCCAIRKDSGDDPDVTNGMLVYAKVSRCSTQGIFIDGGEGVGRVTKPGLDCPVGGAAINRIPRCMIEENVRSICERYGYHGGLSVIISIPEGRRLAAKTFNPKLGIVGGLSVLGTSGIVEPMSDDALIGTIRAELSVLRASGADYALLTPGNYGKDFLTRYGSMTSIKCSNFIGDALDLASDLGFTGVFLVGHIGKLIKLAVGNMNTHSKWGDPRMEILTAYSALAGVGKKSLQQIMESVTIDEGLGILMELDVAQQVIKRILEKIEENIKGRWQDRLEVGGMLFSNRYGILGQFGRMTIEDIVSIMITGEEDGA